MKIEAKLSWVLVNGILHNVKDFSHLRPKNRPKAICPECEREVILRLGTKRIFHSAHKPSDVCILSQPETALHLNTKLFIANELKRQKSILINILCSENVNSFCMQTKEMEYMAGWDEVFVEYRIDQYRPDIVLLNNKKVIGAIEVFVTHSIEPEKEVHLKSLKVPWIEVDANSVYDNNGIFCWKISKSLPYKKINKDFLKSWKCSDCIKEEYKKKQKEEKITFHENYEITAFKIVDFYYLSGGFYRSIFFAKKKKSKGTLSELIIDENNQNFCSVRIKNLKEDQNTILKQFNSRLKDFENKGHVVDSHMRWEKWSEVVSTSDILKHSINAIFPRRYYWSKAHSNWKKISALEKLNWSEFFGNRKKYFQFLEENRKEYLIYINKRNKKIEDQMKEKIMQVFFCKISQIILKVC